MPESDLYDFRTDSMTECHARCEKTSDCIGWVFDRDAKKCWLKDRYALKITDASKVTAILSRGKFHNGSKSSEIGRGNDESCEKKRLWRLDTLPFFLS